MTQIVGTRKIINIITTIKHPILYYFSYKREKKKI